MPNTIPAAVPPGAAGSAPASAVAARPPRWGETDGLDIGMLKIRPGSSRAGGPAGVPVRVVTDPMDQTVQIAPIQGWDRPGLLLRGLAMGGEIDLGTVAQLRTAVAVAVRAVRASPGVAVVFQLDLTDVTFMDSTALYALGAVHTDVSGRGWTLRVTPPAARGPRRLLLFAASQGWLPRT